MPHPAYTHFADMEVPLRELAQLEYAAFAIAADIEEGQGDAVFHINDSLRRILNDLKPAYKAGMAAMAAERQASNPSEPAPENPELTAALNEAAAVFFATVNEARARLGTGTPEPIVVPKSTPAAALRERGREIEAELDAATHLRPGIPMAKAFCWTSAASTSASLNGIVKTKRTK